MEKEKMFSTAGLVGAVLVTAVISCLFTILLTGFAGKRIRRHNEIRGGWYSTSADTSVSAAEIRTDRSGKGTMVLTPVGTDKITETIELDEEKKTITFQDRTVWSYTFQPHLLITLPDGEMIDFAYGG